MNGEWLMKCYEMKKRVPLRQYLIGDAIVPADEIYEMGEEDGAPALDPPATTSNGNQKTNSSNSFNFN